jgi:hypothetical protein
MESCENDSDDDVPALLSGCDSDNEEVMPPFKEDVPVSNNQATTMVINMVINMSIYS